MEDNIIPPDFSAGESIQWRGNAGEFIEFIMILADLSLCINDRFKKKYKQQEFNSLCDSLGNSLLNTFKVDITPFRNFQELRKNTILSYQFTRRIIEQLERLKEDRQFYSLLEERGITPSFEVMANEIILWKNTEKLATLLWLYLKME
ncbi:MAG TPA: hypothetical protein PLS00_00320 [Niabella sp.]|jgi:hypothetical protein|nr:hypothetical protein [Niabella sp.]